MDTHANHSQKHGTNVPIIVIASAIWLFANPAISAASESTAPQKAVGFLKNQISAIAKQLLKDFPRDAYTIESVATFYRQCNSPDKAIALLEQGLGYHPNNLSLCVTMGETVLENGQYDKSVKYLKKAMEISPENLELYDKMADALMSSGDNKQSVQKLEDKINKAQFPNLPAAARSGSYYLLGQGYMQLENYEKAKQCYEKAIEITPDHPDRYYWLAKVYARLGQPEKAKKYMEAHRKLKAELDIKKNEWARKEYRKVIDISSHLGLKAFPEIMSDLSAHGVGLYRDNNDIEKAKQLWVQAAKGLIEAIAIYPKQSDMYRELAFLHLATNSNIADTIDLAKKAVALKRSAKNYFILYLAYYKNSDQANALVAIRKALELEPDNPMYRQKYNEIKRRKK